LGQATQNAAIAREIDSLNNALDVKESDKQAFVRFEVVTAVTMKNGVFWDGTSCGSCKNRRFRGT
jgi:hypothetical protein